MHYLYIIFSESLNTYYTGETSNLNERLEKHNKHYYKGGFSKIAEDWRVVLSKRCKHRGEALYLESFIKRMKSKKFIQKIIKNPKILDDILNNRE